MIPYSDGIAARRFPIVNVALIAANFAVFLFYELPDPNSAIRQASFLRGAAGGHVVPESPSESRGSARRRDRKPIRAHRLVTAHRRAARRAQPPWSRRHIDSWKRTRPAGREEWGAGVAIVRPDRTVMQAGRSVDALTTALPPFTTESEL